MECTEFQKEKIYRDYHDKVLGFLISKTSNYDLSEDICSDVFLKVYGKLDTFDEKKASLSTWIYTITNNTLTDFYRTRKVQEEIPEDINADYLVEEEVCNNEMLDILADALEKLDKRSRDIIILRYYSGKTLKEIAEQLGISYAYVKLLHGKALDTLKSLLKDQKNLMYD